MDPVVPTFSKSSRDLLDDPQSVLWHLISHALQNPGGTSSMFEEDLLSFRVMQANFGSDFNGLATDFGTQLQRIVQKHYPNAGYLVHCSAEIIDSQTFRIVVGIFDNGGAVLSLQRAKVIGDNIEIDNGANQE